MKDLIAFEEHMIELVHQIRFRKVKSNFKRILSKVLDLNHLGRVFSVLEPKSFLVSLEAAVTL